MSRDYAVITALTRLLAVFFCIKSLDEACGSIFYIVQFGAHMPNEGPSPWPPIIAVVTFYILISLAVFFSAPLIAKSLLPFKDQPTKENVSWNDSIIFCSGIFFVFWGITRIVEWMRGHMPGVAQGNSQELIYLGVSLLILLTGVIFTFKFYMVSKWMEKKS